MPVTINGTTGVSGVDGSAGTPAVQGGDNNTGMFFPAADTIAFAEGGVEAMRIDSSGNVGIGTSSPGRILDVSKSGDAVMGIATTGTATQNNAGVRIGSPNKAYLIQTGETDVSSGLRIFDLTAGTERARIDSSGNLLVNTTGTSYGEKFAVVNSGASANLAYFLFNSANDRDALIVRHLNATGGTAGTMLSFLNASGTAVGSIRSNVSATAYNTSSDYRLKENIQPMTGALTKVAALKPVTYKWKVNGFDGQGFIAHELQAIVPECVTGEKDAVDAEGKPVYQGIDTSFLVATLTAAIQELKAEVDALKAQLGAQA